jgi:hypothetical protein
MADVVGAEAGIAASSTAADSGGIAYSPASSADAKNDAKSMMEKKAIGNRQSVMGLKGTCLAFLVMQTPI